MQPTANVWTKGLTPTWLVTMGLAINTPLMENCPTLSPNGRYLFFSRFDGVNSNAFWVSTEIIETIRNRVTAH